MTVNCDHCGSAVADLARLCTRCTRKLQMDLHEIPALVHDLDDTITRQTRMTTNGGGARPTDPGLPFNLEASIRGDHLAGILRKWTSLVADTRNIAAPPPGSDTASGWLLRHIVWIRHHPDADTALVEIGDAVRSVRAIIDRPPDRWYCGPCDHCERPLYATPGATQVACRYCTAPDGGRLFYGVSERRDWMLRAAEDIEATAPDIARALTSLVRPIAPELIRTWAARGRITPTRTNEQGRPLFRLGDVVELMLTPTTRKAG